ncbi:MAG: hypothetical protein ABIS21_08325 [Acidimicrobiales bacterium]
MSNSRRGNNRPWKHIYGLDRHYTARYDRAADRGQLTLPGTQPKPTDVDKVKRKKLARAAYR